MKKIILLLLVGFVTIVTSCKKGPGEGGQATIYGKVWEEEWPQWMGHDSIHDHWGMEKDVYIIYGDAAAYGNRTKSGPDGVFQFQYLRAGKYVIYVYSDSQNPGGKEAVKKEFDIPDDKVFDAGVFTIKRK